MVTIKTSKLITIDRHINEEQVLHPEATGEFTFLLHDLTFAIRLIEKEIRRAGLTDILGMTENINIHGEGVKKLDQYAYEVIYKAMDHNGNLCVMACEESDDIMKIPENYPKGKYVLVFDPLDGSSNIDVNITLGTIFGFYKRLDPTSRTDGTIEDVLQPGRKLVAAGYVLYGSSTMLVYTTGHGVHEFTYDPTIGEFLLTGRNICIPEWNNQYSINEGYYHRWDEKIRRFVDYIKTPSPDKKRPYTLRYVGTAVADVHRVLHYGGIFMYPADSKNPYGKLRLLYEANPLSFIVEQAGGMSTDGKNNILDIVPEKVHQRTPLFIGSSRNVEELMQFLQD
ncbi:MAG: class 1 fructose-bisphosphatase [Candidatus Kapaibacteriales bacterium]